MIGACGGSDYLQGRIAPKKKLASYGGSEEHRRLGAYLILGKHAASSSSDGVDE
jgi:hypothetical protein